MRSVLAVLLALAATATLSGCYVYGPPPGPVAVACPPGMHPGPYGHRCFYN